MSAIASFRKSKLVYLSSNQQYSAPILIHMGKSLVEPAQARP